MANFTPFFSKSPCRLQRYALHLIMILFFQHKGLRRLYEEGITKDFSTSVASKLENILSVIDQAEDVKEIGLFPGWRLHRLKGNYEGFWSVTVTGNWRLIFRFTDGNTYDLDYIDYH